jgi:DinB superfamily
MCYVDRNSLLHRLEEARVKIEELLPKIDPEKEVYPGWSIKHLLAHITGWDDASIDALRAHGMGCLPSFLAIHGLDKYNELTVSSCADLTYEQIRNEWRLKRHVLREITEQLPEEKLLEPLAVPWGKKTTVARLVDIFCHHEEEHARDINEWLKQPEKPLEKAGR